MKPDLVPNNEQLQQLLGAAPDALVVVSADGLIAYASERCSSVLGWTPQELCGQQVDILVPERFREQHDRKLRAYVTAPSARPLRAGLDLYALRRDGSEFPVEISLSPLRVGDRLLISSAIRDVSEQRLIQEQLRSSHDLLEKRVRERTTELQSIFQTAGVTILTLSPEGRILEWNPEAERVFGFKREQVLGHDYIQEFLPAAARSGVEAELKRVASGHESRGFENTVRARAGVERTLLWNATRLLDAEGQITGVLACGQDITDYKRAQAKLREDEGLARLGTMAAVVAHEIKNPLAGIAGAVQMLEDDLPPEHKNHKVFGMIQDRIKLLTHTLEDLLHYARPPRLQPQPLRLLAGIEGVVSRFLQASERSGLDIKVRGEEVTVPFDAQQLEPVFLNLLSNAAEAMEDHGPLTIDIQRLDGACLVSIADTGPGIPADQLAAVTEPFFTTKAKGTGLGLSTAKRLVEAHGGSLDLICPPTGGTTVKIRLPLQG